MEQIKGKWLLCEHCIEAIKSRGERVIKLEEVNQEIDYDEEKGEWFNTWDENESVLKCEWCEEPNLTLWNCD